MTRVCEKCRAGESSFHLGRVCCAARFLLTVQDREERKAWLAMVDADKAAVVEDLVRRAWLRRREPLPALLEELLAVPPASGLIEGRGSFSG